MLNRGNESNFCTFYLKQVLSYPPENFPLQVYKLYKHCPLNLLHILAQILRIELVRSMSVHHLVHIDFPSTS